jgi:chromatin remodeling complex protein RSC6
MPKEVAIEVQDDCFAQFEQLVEQLGVMKTQMTSMQQSIKCLEKSVKKQMKGLKKEATKTKAKGGTRMPSGFAKPCKVTKELCAFMNKNEGTEIARTEVTRALIAYIKENKLENSTNSKIIAPDEKLKVLLGIEDGQELNYFNIQKYMNKHFVKNIET